MKRTTATLLVSGVLGLCLCGKGNNATGPSSADKFVQDTTTVRQILDANGLATVSYSQVAYLTDSRVSSLRLVPATLGGGTIHTVPSSIGNLTELTSLTLDTNQISELPATIGNLTKLTVLSIKHDNLTQIPTQIGQCPDIASLYLSHNQLTALPTSIVSLTKLHALFIDSNAITTAGLPPGLANDTTIGILQVGGNKICSPVDPGLVTLFNTYAELDWSTEQTCP